MCSFMQSPAVIFLSKGNENFSFKLPVIKSVNFEVDFRSINTKVNSKKKTKLRLLPLITANDPRMVHGSNSTLNTDIKELRLQLLKAKQKIQITKEYK